MCICKQRSQPGKASPAAAGRSVTGRGNNRRSNLINKGMPPPPAMYTSTATNKKDIALPGKPRVRHHHHHHHQASTPTMSSLSLRQVSHILDPFFDTCISVRGQRHTASRNANAPLAAADHESGAQEQQRNVESAFLSASSIAQVGDAKADPTSAGVCSLRDFLAPENSAWMDMIQQMETEKNDVLRLDVRLA